MPLLRKQQRREAGSLRDSACGKCVPEFDRPLESESCPLALKVIAERARESALPRNAPREGPSSADVVGD